jgi:cytoskeletal protein RodZ
VSIGDTLAAARGQAGLSVTQVSEQTRIRESIIRSIEAGDFSPCGGDFYARGHIRSIAEVVGTDPAPLVREYDEEHGDLGGMRAAQIFEPATPIKIREPRRGPLGKVLVVLLLLVVGFGVYHLVSSHGSSAPSAAAASKAKVRSVVAATPTPVAKPKAKAKASPKPPAKAKTAPVAVIRLTAESDCWVGLTTADGQSLYGEVVSAGQSMKWDETEPVTLVLGNPSGVQLSVDGQSQATDSAPNVMQLSIDPHSKTPVTGVTTNGVAEAQANDQ